MSSQINLQAGTQYQVPAPEYLELPGYLQNPTQECRLTRGYLEGQQSGHPAPEQ